MKMTECNRCCWCFASMFVLLQCRERILTPTQWCVVTKHFCTLVFFDYPCDGPCVTAKYVNKQRLAISEHFTRKKTMFRFASFFSSKCLIENWLIYISALVITQATKINATRCLYLSLFIYYDRFEALKAKRRYAQTLISQKNMSKALTSEWISFF